LSSDLPPSKAPGKMRLPPCGSRVNGYEFKGMGFKAKGSGFRV
jgi:hypothetical protein